MKLTLYLRNESTKELTEVSGNVFPPDLDLLQVRCRMDDWLDSVWRKFGRRPTEGCRWILAVDEAPPSKPVQEPFKWGQGKGKDG